MSKKKLYWITTIVNIIFNTIIGSYFITLIKDRVILTTVLFIMIIINAIQCRLIEKLYKKNDVNDLQ